MADGHTCSSAFPAQSINYLDERWGQTCTRSFFKCFKMLKKEAGINLSRRQPQKGANSTPCTTCRPPPSSPKGRRRVKIQEVSVILSSSCVFTINYFFHMVTICLSFKRDFPLPRPAHLLLLHWAGIMETAVFGGFRLIIGSNWTTNVSQ